MKGILTWMKNRKIIGFGEFLSAKIEGVDLNELKEVKEGYIKAVGELRKVISSEKVKKSKIIYKPSIFFRHGNPASVDRKGRMKFSYPNGKFKFDYYPKLESKIGIVAHELFGHPADDEQYYGDYDTGLEEFNKYITPEQRADLRAFHALPREIYKCGKEEMNSAFKREKIKIPKNKKTGELLENLYALEFLGRCGLERSHDPVEFFGEFYEETGIPADKLLKKYWWFSFAGLATSPEMNEDCTYGIKKWDDLREVRWNLAEFLRGNNPNYRNPKLITKVGGYSPLNAVDLRWIRKERALKNFDGALKGWEKKKNKYKGVFPYWEDVYSQAVEAKERVKREL